MKGFGRACEHSCPPARDCAAQVDCGDGAVMSIANPYSDDSLQRGIRYGNPVRMRYVAASVIDSYDYLLSSEIPMKEAVRRLRLLRKKRLELLNEAADREWR
jgi:hypothetical protein